MALVVKNLTASARDIRDVGSVPGSVRSPGGGYDNPLSLERTQPSLENPMNREAWRATVHGVTKSQAQLKRLSTHMHTRGFGKTHSCLC